MRQYRRDHDLLGLIERHWTQYLIYLALFTFATVGYLQNKSRAQETVELAQKTAELAHKNAEAVALIQRVNMERRAEACDVRSTNKRALKALVLASFEDNPQGTFTLIIDGQPAQVEVPAENSGIRNQQRKRLLAVVEQIPEC